MQKWRDTRVGNLMFGIYDLFAAYVFGSKAIDSGNLLVYSITMLLLILSVYSFTQVVKGHGKK